jgi:serine/threonine protein kinase
MASRSPVSLYAGKRISETLTLVRPLGAGAMGELWVASDAHASTEVAVKFISSESLRSLRDADFRFLREAMSASRIDSPFVVKYLDYAQLPDGTPYIVMELLDGEELDERLKRCGPFSTREALTVLNHVGSALDAGREVGVVHRDIKPQNLFVTSLDDSIFVKVLDFGNAKTLIDPIVENLSLEDEVVGSPAYVSRDLMLNASKLDYRADLWALGVSVFKCLTGELPFQGANVAETARAIRDGDLKRASSLRAELGPKCDAWFERVFHARPRRRPSSGAEMAQSFANAMGVPFAIVVAKKRSSKLKRVLMLTAAALVVAGTAIVTSACSNTAPLHAKTMFSNG